MYVFVFYIFCNLFCILQLETYPKCILTNLRILDAAATECRQMKRPKHQPLAHLPHPEASGTITSAPLAPAPLGTTPPPSPRIPDTGRSRSPASGRPLSVCILVHLYPNHHLHSYLTSHISEEQLLVHFFLLLAARV